MNRFIVFCLCAMTFAYGNGVSAISNNLDDDNPSIWAKANDESLMQSAKSGDADAQFELGLRYMKGKGRPRSYKEAAHWFEASLSRFESDEKFKNENEIVFWERKHKLQTCREATTPGGSVKYKYLPMPTPTGSITGTMVWYGDYDGVPSCRVVAKNQATGESRVVDTKGGYDNDFTFFGVPPGVYTLLSYPKQYDINSRIVGGFAQGQFNIPGNTDCAHLIPVVVKAGFEAYDIVIGTFPNQDGSKNCGSFKIDPVFINEIQNLFQAEIAQAAIDKQLHAYDAKQKDEIRPKLIALGGKVLAMRTALNLEADNLRRNGGSRDAFNKYEKNFKEVAVWNAKFIELARAYIGTYGAPAFMELVNTYHWQSILK